jgi:ABC-type Mn2+/Zn2+ transport system permease subunit
LWAQQQVPAATARHHRSEVGPLLNGAGLLGKLCSYTAYLSSLFNLPNSTCPAVCVSVYWLFI